MGEEEEEGGEEGVDEEKEREEEEEEEGGLCRRFALGDGRLPAGTLGWGVEKEPLEGSPFSILMVCVCVCVVFVVVNDKISRKSGE